jgi:hypothetical protein
MSAAKDKWLFAMTNTDLFAIAGTWPNGAADGDDAWTMLTCAPDPTLRRIMIAKSLCCFRRNGRYGSAVRGTRAKSFSLHQQERYPLLRKTHEHRPSWKLVFR